MEPLADGLLDILADSEALGLWLDEGLADLEADGLAEILADSDALGL